MIPVRREAREWVERLEAAHIKVKELVTRELYELIGDNAVLLFDPVILAFIISVRTRIGDPVNINTWPFGGAIDGRGFRDNSETTGGPGSAHRKGQGIDFTVQGWTAADARAWILDNYQTLPAVSRMERVGDWVHVDTYESPTPGELYLFYP